MELVNFFKYLNVSIADDEFIFLLKNIDNSFEKEKLEFDDVTYYSFFNKGIEIGVVDEKINHIHFFLQPINQYQKCDLIFNMNQLAPLEQGGGKEGMIGYINLWKSYVYNEAIIRIEYDKNGEPIMLSLLNKASWT